MPDPRYTALIAAWGAGSVPAGFVGTPLGVLSTANKIIAVNGWSATGSVPINFAVTGSQILGCINYAEFKALTAQQQSNILMMCACVGSLQSGSSQTAQLLAGMFIDYFTTTSAIASGTYNNATGVVTLTMSVAIKFAAGGNIVVSGLTGTGAFASLNGTFVPIAPTSGTTVTYNAGAGLGVSTITGGALVPPTIAALTALAQGIVTYWWSTPVAQGGGGLLYPIIASDCAAAGGLT